VWEQGKKHLSNISTQSVHFTLTRLATAVGDEGSPAQASSHLVLKPFQALVTDLPVRLGVQSNPKQS